MSLPETLTTTVKKYEEVGKKVQRDIQSVSALPIVAQGDKYRVTDTEKKGIEITYSNQSEEVKNTEQTKEKLPLLSLDFPKDYSQPIEVKLDEKRTIRIEDLSGKSDYAVSTITRDTSRSFLSGLRDAVSSTSLWQGIRSLGKSQFNSESEESSLYYESPDGRKSLFYTFSKDLMTQKKTLKHWTIYAQGTGVEQEEYRFSDAEVRVQDDGTAEVYYLSPQEIQNKQVQAEVGSELMARAQRVLEREASSDITINHKIPDIIIPAPYFLDKNGERHDMKWKWHEGRKTLVVEWVFDPALYPIALDPTLIFSIPGQSNAGSIITSGSNADYFGASLTTGDFNGDGKIDLVVSEADYENAHMGRVYIFYSPQTNKNRDSADVILTNTDSFIWYFGTQLASGDFNNDGKTDLAVSASAKVFIFYAPLVTKNASSADAVLYSSYYL